MLFEALNTTSQSNDQVLALLSNFSRSCGQVLTCLAGFGKETGHNVTQIVCEQEELKGKATMLAVYITEAHAMDEWPISSARCNGDRGPVNVRQPTADEERCALARTFCQNFDFKVPMVVDPVSNPFDVDFAPWPIRFYIIHKGKLAHKVSPSLFQEPPLESWPHGLTPPHAFRK